MRLFFAIELPSSVQAALGHLRPRSESADYRWVDPSLLHVTLVFLGEQPEERLPRLEAIATEAASACRQASLRLGEAGAFGGRRAPRVLWVGLEGDIDALLDLQSRLDALLRQGVFDIEDRPFRPHITLARRRERATGGAPPTWPPAQIQHAGFTMDRLTLFQSRLSPRGPTYIPLLHAPLRG